MNANIFSWLDIVIGVVLILFAISGYREGFIKSALRLVVLVLSYVSAKLLTPTVADLLMEKTKIYQSILDTVSTKIVVNMQTVPSADGDLGLFGKILEKINSGAVQTTSGLAESISVGIYNIFCFVAVFFASWLVLKIISSIIEHLAELPVIKTFNKLGGFLMGALKGVIVLIILLNAAYYLNMIIGIDSLTKAFDSSLFMKYFYLTNIVSLFASKNVGTN